MTIICHLSNRGVLSLEGEDRRTFLQGLISNDITLCVQGSPLYAALLSPQGKFLHDMIIVDNGDRFFIDCEIERAGDLIKRLSAFKLRAKINIENVSGTYEVWAAWSGPAPMGFYEDPRLKALGARGIIKKNSVIEGEHKDFALYDQHRLMHGIPDGSRDMIVEKSTLLECNLDHLNAISWTKGCYMGQELTARMHYRGLLKKRLFPVTIEGPAPSLGLLVQQNGTDVGEMRSSFGNLGLALLNIERAMIGPLICQQSKLGVHKPEWLKA
ncbi:MAG: folate-binding protein [Alphaproteobacteria bacterium]